MTKPHYYDVSLECMGCVRVDKTKLGLHNPHKSVKIGCKVCRNFELLPLPSVVGMSSTVFRSPLVISIQRTY